MAAPATATAAMRKRARTGLERLPCYDAAPDDLIAVVEDGGLTRSHQGRGSEVERRVASIHVDVCGKWDAAVPQDHIRGETGCRRVTCDEVHVGQGIAPPCDLSTRAHDRRASLGVQVQDVQALAGRDADPRSLADRQRADTSVRADDGPVGSFDRPGDESLRRALAYQL